MVNEVLQFTFCQPNFFQLEWIRISGKELEVLKTVPKRFFDPKVQKKYVDLAEALSLAGFRSARLYFRTNKFLMTFF